MGSMTPTSMPPDDRPTWKDLAEFTARQAKDDRDVIDKWFKRASLVSGMVVASVFLAFVGWRTIDGAKESANEAARAKVREILQDDRIQKLARDAASDLFKNGAYAQLVSDEVAKQLPRAVATEMAGRVPPLVNAEVAKSLPLLVINEVSKHDTYRQVSQQLTDLARGKRIP